MKIVCDSREKSPYRFLNCSDVEAVKGTLQIGDYAPLGLENYACVERKELGDLVTCLGVERARFERELLRASALPFFAVVVEATWEELASGKYRSRLSPASAMASVWSFTSRMRVPFLFAGSRERAELATAGLLRQWVRGESHKLKAVEAALRTD